MSKGNIKEDNSCYNGEVFLHICLSNSAYDNISELESYDCCHKTVRREFPY